MAIEDIKKLLIHNLYQFEILRSSYGLCSPRTGFFQPFKTASDLQQQIKTTLVSPLVGLNICLRSIINLLTNLLILPISLLLFSSDLLIKGFVYGVSSLEAAIVTPLVAVAVTLASLVSMLTRTLATVLSYDGGEFKNDLLSFLPANPYANIKALI